MAYFPSIAIGVPFFRGGSVGASLYDAYKARVLADSGNIDESEANLVSLLNQLNGAVPNFTNTCKLAYAPHWGKIAAAGTGGTSGNRAANKLYNIFGASGDLVQATAASQPLLLRHTGTNYAYLPGISGNYFTTPNAAANQLLNDFGIEAFITPSSLSGARSISCKDSGGATTSNFTFRLNASTLQLIIYQGSNTFTYTSTINFSFTANQSFYVRFNRNSTNGEILFFTSSDGINYTQLGTTVTGITGALNNVNRVLEIGSAAGGLGNLFQGEINYVKLFKDNTFTTVTQYFNPANYNRSVSQTTFTASTGEVYTINVGSATTGLKAIIVDKGIVMGNGTSYAMQAPSFNLNAGSFTSYKIYRKFNNSVVSIPFELSADAENNEGFYEAINGVPSCDGVGARANVGFNSTVFNSNSLLMKVTTFDWDFSRGNPESLYYVNNVAASVNSAGGSAENTANMNGTGYNLFGRNNGASLWANAVLFGDLIFEGVHDTATRTAVFNI
jgi:hypothetical protein